MPKKELKFHGILAVGRTKADAKNNYRLLAMSKGASMQVDSERNIAFVAQASLADGMFNPQSGNMDLETDESLISKVEFKSNSSGEVEVNHLVCESGCGAHVVFDSEELVKFCPNCTSELSESSDDEDGDDDGDEDDLEAELGPDEDDESSESAEDEEGDESAEGEEDGTEEGDESAEGEEGDESAEDEEGTEEGDESDEEGDDLPDYTEDDGAVKVESSDNDGLIIAAASFDEAERLFRENAPTVSISSANGVVEAHYMLCKDKDCGAHLLSDKPITACCACQGEVEEPPVKAAAEDETKAEGEAKPAVAEGEAKPAVAEASGEGCSESDDDEGEGEGEGEDNTLELTDEEGNVLGEDTEDVDAMADVDEESDSASLDVSYSSSVAGQARWTAFYKGVPVAMASKSSAGKNADIFDTPSFGHAALATAKVAGVRKALAELGFEPIRHKVSVSREVRRMVDAQVAEARTSLSSEQQQFKDRFMAALAAAAIGLNRGFFAEKKNPIKATLWNAMSSAGIRNPESLIDSAFRSHSDAYHKTLFELASDLVSKSADVQESISKAIQGMGYLEASTSNDQSLESRLETLGTSTSSGHVQQETQPATAVDRTNITKAVQTLGRRSR